MIKKKTLKQKKADQKQKEKATAKLFKRAKDLRRDMWDSEFNAQWVHIRSFTRLFSAVRSYEIARDRANETHVYSDWDIDQHGKNYDKATSLRVYKD